MKVMGAGILAIEKTEGKILLGRRSFKVEHPNCWSIFGGTFNKKDIIPKNTAIREFLEETKCKDKFFIQKTPFYICEDNHVKFYTHLGIFNSTFIPIINSEHLEFGWFEIDKMPDNLHPGFQELMDQKHQDLLKIF